MSRAHRSVQRTPGKASNYTLADCLLHWRVMAGFILHITEYRLCGLLSMSLLLPSSLSALPLPFEAQSKW